MQLFAVMTPTDHAGLQGELHAQLPNDHLKIGPGQWIVAARTTAVELSNVLGISDGRNGLAVVVAVSGYYGRAPQNVWEWMKVKGSAP